MADERNTVRRIAWCEVFPWLLILRTFRLAISPSLLALATLGALLMPVGWRLAGFIFLEPAERQHFERATLTLPASMDLSAYVPAAIDEYLPRTRSGIAEVHFQLTERVRRLFDWTLSLRQTAFYLFGNLWSLLVWAFIGGVITRSAVVQLGCDETPDILDTLRFVARRYLWYLFAPLYPLGGVVLVMLPLALLGLVMRLDVGVVVAGFLWIFVIAISLVTLWLLIGLIFGWPLMWPAVSAERDGDSFEAFSRSFSYVYGKPLNLFFYFVVAAIFGALCWSVVNLAIEILLGFGFSAVSWGASGERVQEIQNRIATGNYRGALGFGAQLIGWVVGLGRLVKDGYSFSYFFCAAAAIYLLMRSDVDQMETDIIHGVNDVPRESSPAVPTV